MFQQKQLNFIFQLTINHFFIYLTNFNLLKLINLKTDFLKLVAFILFLVVQTNGFSQMRSADQEPFVPGELIVKIDKKIDQTRLFNNLPAAYNFRLAQELSPFINAWLVTFNPQQVDQMVALRMVQQVEGILVAQNNHFVQMREVPNDPQLNQQWHHLNDGTGGTADADIDTDEAWEITTGGTNALGHDIVVCILEGVNFSHVDLVDNHWINTAEIPGNDIDDDGNGYIDDIHGWNVGNNSGVLTGSPTGHGTSVAGMIGAKGNNGVGVVGANWNVKMLNVQGYNLTEASVIAAYNYPLTLRQKYNQTNGAEGAFVVATNASWGIDNANPANYPIWCGFYNTLGAHGILNCGATTNANLNVDVSGDMPTACSSPYMVGVGRSDRNDNFAGGYGLTTINFAAPGINVRTTSDGNNYTTTTGTSFASPLTAGVVALLYAIPCTTFMTTVLANPQQGADLVLEALMEGVDQKPQLENFFVAGGRINAKNSMDLLMENNCNSCARPTQLTANDILENTTTITFNLVNTATNYTIYYRIVGQTAWSNLSANNSPFNLTNLTSCANYEYYINATCPEGLSDNTAIFNFRTKGCGACLDESYCLSQRTNDPVASFVIHSPSNLNATISNFIRADNWGASLDAAYVFGEMVLVNDGSATPTLACNPLTNSSQINGKIAVAQRGSCDFSSKAFNAQTAGAIALIIINNQVNAPAALGAGTNAGNVTIPVVMITQAQGANLLTALQNNQTSTALLGKQNEWIQSFEIANETFNTGNNNGYTGAIETDIDLIIGANYPFTLTSGQNGPQLAQYSRIWLDNNQNGVFEANELLYDQNNALTGVLNGQITIPETALEGLTRMRVQMVYQGYGSAALPGVCGNFQSGETEDYCVNVTTELSIIENNRHTFVLYPNPSTGQINIVTDLNELVSVKIFDAIGKEIFQIAINSNNQIIDLSHLSDGLYIVQSKTLNGFIKTDKLILRK